MKNKIILLLLAALLCPGIVQTCQIKAQDRPNILWLVSEDNSPFLGCYGDSLALTPKLDRLAESGIRYMNAYATSPVCSAARSTLITGSYGLRYGIHHHRSAHPMPEEIRPYPEFFRAAGYYCTNNSKKDYNLVNDYECWNESGPDAHYKNREPGQPFFAIFNFAQSHESRTFPTDVKRKRENGTYPPVSRVNPADIRLPAYHPDKPEIRQEWADYYDAVTHMDQAIGLRLSELEASGLREETIIIYYADHGGALARGKRSVKESGTRVPLIMWFPKKWQHLAPAAPGESVNRLVSFVDFPATMLSLMGAEIPDQMKDALPFLGPASQQERDFVFLYRGRMDARYDMVRSIKTDSFRYIINYTPYRPAGQYYNYAEFSRITPVWRKAWENGECNEAQSHYWELKPAEELYCTVIDPDEVNNLVHHPAYQKQLKKLRKICHQEILRIRDVGFIPESMYARLAGDSSINQWAQSKKYDLKLIKKVADRAIQGDPQNIPYLQRRMHEYDPLVRYWAVTGSMILGDRTLLHKTTLMRLLEDPCPEVRIRTAEAIGRLGETDMAIAQIFKELEFDPEKDIHIYALAADVLVYLDPDRVKKHLDRIREISSQKRYGNGARIAQGLLQSWGLSE